MRAPDERRFRRLLRWYPHRWRQANGAVLVSTMLDSAERDGRTSPTTAECFAAVVHGTAARIDRRLALVLAASAVAFAVLAGVLSMWAPPGASGVLPVLLTCVVPALAATGLVAVLRDRGLVSDGRALVTMAVSVIALVLNALTYASWSLGFDAADEGIAATGLAALWLPIGLAATVTGATAIALIVESLFRRTALRALPRVLLASLVGLTAAPLVGLSRISAYASAILALGVAILALMPPRHSSLGKAPHPPTNLSAAGPEGQPGFTRSTRTGAPDGSAARLLAVIALAGGLIGVAYALTGAQWSRGAADGTVAMGQGITILLASALPLLTALGLLIAGRSSISPLHVWGPLTLVVIALGFIAVAYLHAPSWDAMAPWFQVASVAGGGALAWWIIPRVRLPRGAAMLIGMFSGLLYASFVGTMLAPMLAFAVPVAAFVIAMRRPRRRGIRQPAARPAVSA